MTPAWANMQVKLFDAGLEKVNDETYWHLKATLNPRQRELLEDVAINSMIVRQPEFRLDYRRLGRWQVDVLLEMQVRELKEVAERGERDDEESLPSLNPIQLGCAAVSRGVPLPRVVLEHLKSVLNLGATK